MPENICRVAMVLLTIGHVKKDRVIYVFNSIVMKDRVIHVSLILSVYPFNRRFC